MRIVRFAMWPPPPKDREKWVPEPVGFMRESDLKNWDEAIAELRKPFPGAFTVVETFDMPGEPSMIAVSLWGAAHYFNTEKHRIERDQALLYYWNIAQMTRLVPTGVLSNSVPHPLTAEQIKAVFEHIAVSPVYQSGQTVIGFGTDLLLVTLRHGKVTVGEKIQP
jgi:hypothetical protein